MADIKPDWENFAKAVLGNWPTGDLDGADLFDLSLKYGMIREIPGGYDPQLHIDADGIGPEKGDPWYEYTFRGEAGPGLYSISAMADRIEALTAERDALAESLEKAARVLSLTRRADDLREAYHRLPNDKNRIGDKRSKKSHARDAWLRAFRKAAREAHAALREGGK